MKYYAYCVTERVLAIAETPAGVDGQSVEFLNIGGLVIVWSKFEKEAVSVTRENVLRHEAVVRSVLAETTPLPFRFGTIVTEESMRNYFTSRTQALLERLAQLRDSVEMSVKIIWHKTADADATFTAAGNVGLGTAFLLAKRHELSGNDLLANEAREIANWLGQGIQQFVRQQNLNVQPPQKLVIAGSYLIDRSAESDFRTAISQLESQRPELHFLTSGPWPPYTFANIDLEFETQFGVS